VYKKHPKSRFKRDCLAEYATYEFQGERLFRTVGADHTFYGPARVIAVARRVEEEHCRRPAFCVGALCRRAICIQAIGKFINKLS
jgi:hypothetical protein